MEIKLTHKDGVDELRDVKMFETIEKSDEHFNPVIRVHWKSNERISDFINARVLEAK